MDFIFDVNVDVVFDAIILIVILYFFKRIYGVGSFHLTRKLLLAFAEHWFMLIVVENHVHSPIK